LVLTSPAPLRSLKRNYFFSAVSALIGILYPIVSLAYVARIMGPGPLGKYYFANSLAAYFLFAACLGTPVYATREIARVHSDPVELKRVFSQIFFINAVSTIFFSAIYAIVVFSVPQFRAEIWLFAILGLIVLNNVLSFDYLFAGLERQDQIAYRSLASKAISIALIFILVRGKGDYLWLAGISVFTAVVNGLLSLNALKYWAGFKELVKGSPLRRHLRPIVLIAISILFINVYVNLDSVILGLISGPHEVGLYSAAIRPCRIVAVLLASMLGAALPRLSYYIAGGGDKLTQRALKKKSLELLLMLAIPVSFTFAVSADQVIWLMYGPGFSEAAHSLILATPLLVLNCVATFHIFQIVVPLGKESLLVYTAIVGAIVSVALNLILIPIIGYQGAILAALAAEMATIVTQVVLLRREGPGLFVFPTQAWKYVVAGAILALIQTLWVPATRGVSLAQFAVWITSAAAYGIALWIMREPLVLQVKEYLAGRLGFRR
jgi:O-antigen/teichoic acid export membrane protein